jgi:hypothetical protein
MSVAAGPYKKLVPFINTEDIRLSLLKGSNRLSVSVRISNETARPSKKTISFGNFVFLTHSRAMAVALCTDLEMLTSMIARPNYEQKNSQMFGLSARDFKRIPIPIGPPGTRQYVHRYSHTVSLEANNQNELYLVVASYRSYKNRISIGNVVRETLLTKGKVPTYSRIYRLEESIPAYGLKGSIWPGSVHRNGQSIMAGNIHVQIKHPKVTSQKIPNIKVKDMRILNLAFARQPVSGVTETAASFISPLEVSRNALGIINGIFSFDMMRYVQASSPLSRIMTNSTSLLDSLEVKDIGIWAKISGQGTAKGNSLTPSWPASCGINKLEGFKKVASLNNGCEVLDTDNNGNEIIEISYVDDNSKGLNSGFKEYRVEILMNNRAKEVIDNMTTELRGHLTKIQDSLNSPRSINTAYYVPERMINLYLDSLYYLFGAETFEPYTRSYWKNNLLAMAYNTQQDSSLKLLVVRVVEVFVNNLNKLIHKTGMSTVTAVNHRSSMGASKTQPLLNFRHKFENKLELQGGANVGLGYIDDVIQNLDSVTPQITFEDYSGRASAEIDKYNIADPQAANINIYGFLSPAFVGLGSKDTIDTGDLQIGMDSLLPLACSQMSLNQVQNNKTQQDEDINKLEILQSQGVAITALKVSLKKEVIAPLIVNAQIIPAGTMLGRTSKFYIDNLKANAVSGSQRSIIRKAARKGLTRSPLIAKMVNKSITNFKPQKEVKNSSLLKGSIALAKTQQDPTIVKESDSMTAITNYGSIAQVQYLAPYKEGLGVKKQNWKILDKYTFEKAKREDTALVCRTVKISNTVDGNSKVELKPLSSIFTLGQPLIKDVLVLSVPTIPRTPGDTNMTSYVLGTLGEEVLYSKNISLPPAPRTVPGPSTPTVSATMAVSLPPTRSDPGATTPTMGPPAPSAASVPGVRQRRSRRRNPRSLRRARSKGNLGY